MAQEPVIVLVDDETHVFGESEWTRLARALAVGHGLGTE